MSDKHLDGRGENEAQHGTRPEKTKARPREGWRSEPDYGLPPKRGPLGPLGPGPALIGVIVAVVLLGGLLAWFETRPRGAAGSSDIGGAFQLVDHNGKPADQSLLNGKWSAVFFGYTYCPDVCPATLQALGQAAMRLTPDQRKTLQVIFVTVDPARDTPQQMKVYLDAQALPVKTIGLTGSAAQVAAVAKAYRVYFKKVGTGDAYTMDHTSVVYLMNPKGGFAAPLAHGMTPDLIAKQITAAERAG